MLNRRILRIKAFKVLYSYAVTRNFSLEQALSRLDASCEATRDLYLWMLSVIPQLCRAEGEKLDAASRKFSPTEEEKNPNRKFADCALGVLLRDDPDLGKLLEKKKLSWDPYDIFIRALLASIKSKPAYADYMAAPGRSLAEDCRFFTKVFEQEFVESEELGRILEDRSIDWVDDLAYALTACCHTLSDLAGGAVWTLPALYLSDAAKGRMAGKGSDKAFVHGLLSTAYAGFDRYSDLVAASAEGWDRKRLFLTDVAILILGLAELEGCPDIPLRVTINEYVELAKDYGTPKSRVFVNGMLDKLARELVAEGRVKKTE